MKRFMVVLAAFMTLGSTASPAVRAQDALSDKPNPDLAVTEKQPVYPKDRYGYLNAGLTKPSSPDAFDQFWRMGPAFGGGFGIGLTRITVFVFDLSYNTFPFNGEKYLAALGYSGYGLSITGGRVHSLLGTANLKFKFNRKDPKVNGYILVGMGEASMARSAMTVTDGVTPSTNDAFSETKFAFRTALGMEIKLNPGIKLYFESNGVSIASSCEGTIYEVLKTGLLFKL